MKNIIFIFGIVLILIFSFYSIYANENTNDTQDINMTNSSDIAICNSTMFNNSTVNNTVIYVSTSGNDCNDGLTPEKSKKTIECAINTVADNGAVYVANGTYQEHLKINKNMSLIGINGSSVRIDGDYKDNTVVIGLNCDVHLKNLIIQNGADSGIVNYGKMSIYNSYIQNNRNGIVNHGNLSIYASKIKKNGWKGIYNEANLTVDDCSILNNSDGIYSFNDNRDCFLTINHTLIQSNKNNGIYTKGILIINDSIICYNGYNLGNGGICKNGGVLNVTNCKIHHNKGFFGGGICNEAGVLNVVNCSITNNKARIDGGGICNEGLMVLVNSTISNNKAGQVTHLIWIFGCSNGNGGGIYNYGDNMTIINCKIKNNIAKCGGGIYHNTDCKRSQSSVFGTDIIGNKAYAGGGIHANHGHINLENVNVKGNYAWHGGGIYTGDGHVDKGKHTEISGNWFMNLGFKEY